MGFEFGGESGRPLLEESFAAGVRGKERGREETTGGSHCKDESALAGDHTGCNGLCDLQGSHAVDGDDIIHFISRCLHKRHWDAVALSHIID